MGICLDQSENAIDCGDPNCTYGDCLPTSVAQTGGVAANTVAPNPSLSAAGGNTSTLTQMTSALGQWGATIAGIVTGQPVVSNQSGVRTGYAAISPAQGLTASPSGMLVLLLIVVAVVFVIAEKR